MLSSFEPIFVVNMTNSSISWYLTLSENQDATGLFIINNVLLYRFYLTWL